MSLLGTFGVLLALGMSINLLTLFALILAIGIVVDDAIVVVENVQRHIDKDGLSPKLATKAAMREVSGAIVATTLVLLAVFIPTPLSWGCHRQAFLAIWCYNFSRYNYLICECSYTESSALRFITSTSSE